MAAQRTLRTLTDSLLNLIFPARCLICKQAGSPLCAECFDQTPTAHARDPFSESITDFHALKRHTGAVRRAIHALKYEGYGVVGRMFGTHLAAAYTAQGWTCDAVATVPMHTDQLLERNYNHAAMIAEACAESLGLPFVAKALTKHRATEHQARLGAEARKTNVKDAFVARPDLITDKRMLLIDDVCTTGATLAACAQTLIQAGAKSVYVLTVSSAVQASDLRYDRYEDHPDFVDTQNTAI